MRKLSVLIFLLVAASFVLALSCSDDDPVVPPKQSNHRTATLSSIKDNTVYEGVDSSNGSGYHMFAGTSTLGNDPPESIRRALLMFDVAQTIPSGSTIDSVSLRLNMSRTHPLSGIRTVSLHRVLADWGEGESHALGNEGIGATARYYDATWVYAFHDSVMWSNQGGDYTSAPSAQTDVGIEAAYKWKSVEMAADVQSWLDTPAANFGWIIVCDESEGLTAKRFDTRENPDPPTRPSLSVWYTVP